MPRWICRAEKSFCAARTASSATIPVDRDGYFYIDWRLTPNDPHLLQAPVESLLAQNFRRLNGETNGLSDDFRGKLVIVGSAAQGNDLTDRGATPLERDTFLVSKHWNIANSVITGQFIRRASLPLELALIIFLGALTAFLTWQLRAFSAAGGIFLLAAVYAAAAFFAFVKFRFWLPLVFPIGGAMLMEHLMLVAYRVMFEEAQKRHVKSVFSRIVSPDVVNELLQAEKLSLGGGRQEITVYFADVRGFTEFTDQSQAKVLEYIRAHNLSGAEAEAAINEEARETLATVNLYLGAVADAIKRHNGTLDKYIGDCAMAFWNAPIPNEKHAAACVRAAIDAQRAIYEMNLKRAEENQKRELETTFMLPGGARAETQAADSDARQRHQHRHGHRRADGFQRASVELHRVRARSEPRQPAGSRFRPQPHHHQRGDLRTFAPRRPGTGGDVHRPAAGEGQGHRRRGENLRGPVASARRVAV